MNIKTAYLYLVDKLNKLSSNFSQNLPYQVAARAINEAQYYWLDERLKTEEINKTVQRETQFLVVPSIPLVDSETDSYIEYKLPDDYYHYSMLDVVAINGSCKFTLNVNLIENSNVSTYLQDEMTKPDYDWEQSFCTVRHGKLAFYKDQTPNYGIDSLVLFYYRKPKLVDIASGHLNETGLLSTDVDLEFSESSSYEILNIAAKILAGNINDQGRFQYNEQLSQEYK